MGNVFQLDILDNHKEEKPKMVKYGFRIYLADWEWLKELVRFEIVKNENLEFTNAKAISDGISLLMQSRGEMKPRKSNVRYRPGRRDNPGEVKITSTYLKEEEAEYLKNYHFYTIFTKGNLDYSQMELFAEIVSGLKEKYQGKF